MLGQLHEHLRDGHLAPGLQGGEDAFKNRPERRPLRLAQPRPSAGTSVVAIRLPCAELCCVDHLVPLCDDKPLRDAESRRGGRPVPHRCKDQDLDRGRAGDLHWSVEGRKIALVEASCHGLKGEHLDLFGQPRSTRNQQIELLLQGPDQHLVERRQQHPG